MKKLFFVSIALSFLLISCTSGNKTYQSGESIASNDSLEEVAAEKAEMEKSYSSPEEPILHQDSIIENNSDSQIVIAFLTDFYNNYLIGANHKDPYSLRSHFSSNVLSRLYKIFNDDDWGENGYAFYALRGYSSDVDGSIKSVTPLGNNWYDVRFTESDFNPKENPVISTKIEAKLINGTVIITDFKNPVYL